MKLHSESFKRTRKYSNLRVIVSLNEDDVLYNIHRPSREGSSKKRANEDEDKTKSDTDATNENNPKNKYTKYDIEIYENKSDEKTDNEKVDPKTINCPICYDNVKIPYVTSCNHEFCYNCIDKLITTSKNQDWACPICRTLCKK